MAWMKVGTTTLADTIHNWNDSTDTGCVISGNDISPASGFTGWNACQAKSSTGITRGGEMSFTIHTSAEGFSTGAGYWGIDEGTTVLTGTTGFDYYMYVDGGVSNVVAYDSNGNSSTTYTRGDILSISIDSSGNVLFKNNGTTFRTSSVTAGTNTYYAQYLSLRSGSGGFGGKDLIASGASNNISVAGLADRKHLMIVHNHLNNGTTMRIGNRMNGTGSDPATNSLYAERRSKNTYSGSTDSTNHTATELNLTNADNTAEDWLGIILIMNISGQEKLQMSFYGGSNTAGNTVPNMVTVVSKFAPSSLTDSVNRWDSVRISGSGQSNAGSNITALGTD
jgi:hypothetical protein